MAFTVLVLAAIIPWMPSSFALAGTSGWIPLEDEQEIDQLQHPERYPVPLLLPDLRTLTPSHVSLVIEEGSGNRLLRFSNAVWNAGSGALELNGDYDPQSEIVHAVQVIEREDGTLLERPAGTFDYHAEHQHVHWDAFAYYQVWSSLPDGSLAEMLTSSEKVGYCLRDIKPYIPPEGEKELLELLNVPRQPGYSSCSWRRQGMSVGWYDIYHSYTSGQTLDISHLPDGTYALVSIVDPNQFLRESDETNNIAMIYFSLQGEQISVLESPDGRSQP
jgi:Lysyl oxidase